MVNAFQRGLLLKWQPSRSNVNHIVESLVGVFQIVESFVGETKLLVSR